MGKFQVLLDEMYKCELCKYYTCNKRDYERHLKTKRHINLQIKCEEASTSNLFSKRMNATDEEDDFKTVSDPLIDPRDIYDSQEDNKTKEKKKTFYRNKKKEEFHQSKLKKTNSGDNIIITYVELDDIENSSNKDDPGDELLYDSIYTNPFSFIRGFSFYSQFFTSFKSNIFKFIKEMFTSAGTPLSHDKI